MRRKRKSVVVLRRRWKVEIRWREFVRAGERRKMVIVVVDVGARVRTVILAVGFLLWRV